MQKKLIACSPFRSSKSGRIQKSREKRYIDEPYTATLPIDSAAPNQEELEEDTCPHPLSRAPPPACRNLRIDSRHRTRRSGANPRIDNRNPWIKPPATRRSQERPRDTRGRRDVDTTMEDHDGQWMSEANAADPSFDMSSVIVPCNIINGYRSPTMFAPENFDAACKYRAHDGDIVLSTYPKCGTTWVQYMICNLLHYDEFDGDLETVKDKCPYLEMFGTQGLKPGSFYKLHLPFDAERFNPDAKYVFVTRNPRDVAVSYYHFTNILPGGVPGVPKGAYWFPRYAELFCKGEIWHGCYMEYHRDWLEGLRKYGKPENVLILVYEKMKKDPRGELLRIANFLGGKAAELVKDEKAVETILERTSVRSMKETVNKSAAAMFKRMHMPTEGKESVDFVRKGVVGDHVNYFTPEIAKMFDEYIAADPRNQEIMEMFNA